MQDALVRAEDIVNVGVLAVLDLDGKRAGPARGPFTNGGIIRESILSNEVTSRIVDVHIDIFAIGVSDYACPHAAAKVDVVDIDAFGVHSFHSSPGAADSAGQRWDKRGGQEGEGTQT